MRARIAAALAVVTLAPVLASACGEDEPTAVTTDGARNVLTVRVGDERVRAEVADTPEERIAGLSGRASLGTDEGMVFPFPAPGRPAFWMKGMRFPVDIIWIGGGRVSEVTADVPPPARGTTDSKIPFYSPRRAVDIVLEVDAGWARRNGVRRGDRVAVRR